VRPTMLVDLGLDTSYLGDGRAITEILDRKVSHTGKHSLKKLQALGHALKQLDAPFGSFGMATLAIATDGIQTNDEDAYAALDTQLAAWGARRDHLAHRIKKVLDRAEFGGATGTKTIRKLTERANALVAEVEAAAP